MSQPLAKTPPAYNSSVLCPCDPIPLLVVLFSIAGTGHITTHGFCGDTFIRIFYKDIRKGEASAGVGQWVSLQGAVSLMGLAFFARAYDYKNPLSRS